MKRDDRIEAVVSMNQVGVTADVECVPDSSWL